MKMQINCQPRPTAWGSKSCSFRAFSPPTRRRFGGLRLYWDLFRI